jgi:two-component system, OmpR family, response regulator MprA
MPPVSESSLTVRVLVVDDDPHIRRMLERVLDKAGYEVESAPDGGTALARIERVVPDILVLDVAMPGIDGLAVTQRLRRSGLSLPVLLLTARDAVPQRVAGLEAGADDYLVKPFDTDELIARLRALLRRNRPPTELLAFGDTTLDPETCEAWRDGRPLHLTRREAQLLELLMRHSRAVVTREAALEQVWGGEDEATSNSVDRYVAYLRRKLGEPPIIETVRGIGFRLRAP